MATEFKPGAKVRIDRATYEPVDIQTKSGPTWRTFAVTVVIAGLVVASLYFSTIGRNAPVVDSSPSVSSGQSPAQLSPVGPNRQNESDSTRSGPER
jgi:hypothetical protein